MKELEKLKQITTSTILMGRDFQKKITRYRQIAYVLFFVDIFLVPFVFICYIAQPGAVINNMLELIFCWILISLVSATAVVYIEDKKSSQYDDLSPEDCVIAVEIFKTSPELLKHLQKVVSEDRHLTKGELALAREYSKKEKEKNACRDLYLNLGLTKTA